MANLETPPQFPSDTKSDNIKERLNLHVKRRLQQDPQSSAESSASAPCSPPKRKGSTGGATSGVRNGKKKRPAGSGDDQKPPEMKKPQREREEKISSTVEILQMILNEKKNSLLRDPEVVNFLEGAVQKAKTPSQGTE
ncbi:uncharacterized protein LOC132256358 [Phlebotomus argentipes]|uniref:uncharacterized protein LOC132256358 n=1 Tax=Phlebotomus argentipes TaxID=94469 RepID=UPI002892AAA7|nr:uncharacterized protein LOC132256358 [Phlebotomus argentipes]